MSDINLFILGSGDVCQLERRPVCSDIFPHPPIEIILETFFKELFLAVVFIISKTHSGRTDTSGSHKSCCPIITEYKRNQNKTAKDSLQEIINIFDTPFISCCPLVIRLKLNQSISIVSKGFPV